MFKVGLVFLTLFFISSGLELDATCIAISKIVLCTNYFDVEERERCMKYIEPVYNWVNLCC